MNELHNINTLLCMSILFTYVYAQMTDCYKNWRWYRRFDRWQHKPKNRKRIAAVKAWGKFFIFWPIIVPLVGIIRMNFHARCRWPKLHKKQSWLAVGFYKVFGMSVNWPRR